MTDQQTDIVEALDAIAKVQMSKEQADTITRAGQLIVGQMGTIAEREQSLRAQQKEFTRLHELNGELQRNLDGLIDEMHAMALENARLHGYQDRVREFDPISDKVAYEDELVSVPRRATRAPRIVDGHDPVWRDPNMNHHANGRSEPARRPWYRLRG